MTAPVKFSSKMDAKVLRELRVYAKESGRSMTALLTEAVTGHLQRTRVRPAFHDGMSEVLRDHRDALARLAK